MLNVIILTRFEKSNEEVSKYRIFNREFLMWWKEIKINIEYGFGAQKCVVRR